ncbi:MAG TPA: VWA domain-containing protein, partial [Pyrinomonadaceae bacterium]|nr:VWA domain-containing protein [Pyrinomonadaceae bacterium]
MSFTSERWRVLCLWVLLSSQQLLAQSDDVVRVKTELVQTDVTVVDKRGRFVSGLTANDLELRVDSKLQPLAFFEEVTAGSVDEEKQLAAARKGDAAKLPKTPGPAMDRGRVIFFFVDDIHLTGESLTRARSVLTNFVENKMTAKDQVAIVSTSGQIGFLQQLTDNKAVLREAISRLNSKYNPEATASHVAISEVDANLVANHGDQGLFSYLVEATMREFQIDALNAYTMVTNRIHQINGQSRLAELDTLSRLESLMRSTTPLAGRKLLFFLSDGFVVDAKRSNGPDVLRRVANEAARVGVVVYTLSTRGNIFGPGIDVSSNGYPDYSPRTASRSLAESKMPQEMLETLAKETGGRSVLNASRLNDGVAEALTETSAYYLLAWRPDNENQTVGKSRLNVVVKGRPDLRVRMRQHYFDFRQNEAKPKAPATNTPDDQLKRSLGSLYPRRDLRVSVAASVVNTVDKGTALNVSMQLDGQSLSFGEQPAIVDVLGVAIDDRGQFSSFKQKVDIPREVLAKDGRFIKWT